MTTLSSGEVGPEPSNCKSPCFSDLDIVGLGKRVKKKALTFELCPPINRLPFTDCSRETARGNNDHKEGFGGIDWGASHFHAE